MPAGGGGAVNLDQLCDDAMLRLQEFINRSAGQHLRAHRLMFAERRRVRAGIDTPKPFEPMRSVLPIDFADEEPEEPTPTAFALVLWICCCIAVLALVSFIAGLSAGFN